MCVSSDGNRCSFLCLGILVVFYNWEEERFLSALKQERNFRGMDKEIASYRESRVSRSKHKTSATLSFINHLRRELYDYIQQRICMSKKLVVSVLNFQVPCPGLASPLLCLAPALAILWAEKVCTDKSFVPCPKPRCLAKDGNSGGARVCGYVGKDEVLVSAEGIF